MSAVFKGLVLLLAVVLSAHHKSYKIFTVSMVSIDFSGCIAFSAKWPADEQLTPLYRMWLTNRLANSSR